MKYPTMEEVERADRLQLARWYRFLPSPQGRGRIKIIDRICERFEELGGMTPEISKAIGWGR